MYVYMGHLGTRVQVCMDFLSACLDNQEVQLVCLYCIDCFKRYSIENKTVDQEVHNMILCFQFRIIVAIGLVL